MSSPAILFKKKSSRLTFPYARQTAIVAGALLIIAVMFWQAFAASGAPDPATKGLSPMAMILSTGVLVFREGLEAILVLAAVTAGMTRGKQRDVVRAVPIGAFVAFIASIVTWLIVVATISKIT